jgi:hypothetical protein
VHLFTFCYYFWILEDHIGILLIKLYPYHGNAPDVRQSFLSI